MIDEAHPYRFRPSEESLTVEADPGLLKQAVVHYASYTAAFAVVGLVAGWIETPADMALVAGIFLVGHSIIWTIMYLRYKAATKELNTLLQESRQGV